METPFFLRNSVKILGEKGYDRVGIHPGIPTAYSKKRDTVYSVTQKVLTIKGWKCASAVTPKFSCNVLSGKNKSIIS